MFLTKKFKQLCAFMLAMIMTFNVIPVNAQTATPTDSAGEVFFVPEGTDGSTYNPYEGAAGVVYDIYDSQGKKSAEFVLSYDGKAYADSDGNEVVYSTKEAVKKSGSKEKTVKLHTGTYSVKQSEKLYKSEKTVATDSQIVRDDRVQYIDIVSGKQTKLKVTLEEKDIPGKATASDAAGNKTSDSSVFAGYTGTAVLADVEGYDIRHEKDVRGATQIICTLFKFEGSLTYNNTGYGFCMEEGKAAPSNYGIQKGSPVVVDKESANIRRALYYSFVGPEPWSGWKDGGSAYNDYNIAGISATLDYYYYHNRKVSYISKYAGFAQQYISWVETQPYPKTPGEVDFRLKRNGKTLSDDSTLDASYNITAKQQKSPVVSVRPQTKDNEITINAPKGVSIMVSKDGKKYTNNGTKAVIKGTVYVYFTAKLGMNDVSDITFKGETGYNAMMLDCGSSYQKVGFLGKGSTKNRTLKVKWSKPRLRLKKVNTEGKVLKDAEYLVYRVENGKKINVVRFKTDKNGDGVVKSIVKSEADGARGDKVVSVKAGIRYYITETVAPAGYALNKGIAHVAADGKEYSYEARFGVTTEKGHIHVGGYFNCVDTGFVYKSTDNAYTGCLSIKKNVIDAAGKANAAAKAVYTMYDSSNAVVAKFTSQKSGYAKVSSLSSKYSSLKMRDAGGKTVSKDGVQLAGIPYGTYRIIETVPPAGCDRQPEKYAAVLKISSDGEVLTYYKGVRKTGGEQSWTKKTLKADKLKNNEYGSSISAFCYEATDFALTVTGCFAMKKSVISADGHKQPAAKAVYTMYDSGNAVVAKFTSQKNGYAVLSALSSKYKTLKMVSASGKTVTKNGVQLTGIPEGTYSIVETTAPEGCDIQPKKYAAVLKISASGEVLTYYMADKKDNGTVSWVKREIADKVGKNGVYGSDIDMFCYEATDVMSGDPLNLVIQKVDAETGKKNTAGAASLEGAVFKLEYYKGKTQDQAIGMPDNTWYINTIYENGAYKAAFGSKYIVNTKEYPSDSLPTTFPNGNFMLDLGTVRITEVSPSEGYLNISEDNAGYIRLSAGGKIQYVDDAPSTSVYLDGSGNTTYFNNVLDKNTIEIYEPVKRGDIELDKKKVEVDGSLSPMANVVFRITSATTGECHYVMTDEYGRFSSKANKNTYNTNKNCEGYIVTEDGYEQHGMDSSYGLWFTGDSDIDCQDIDMATVSDERGALPYDTYIIEEMRCDANKGYVLSEPQKVTVDKNGETVSVKEDFVNVPYTSLTTLADHFAGQEIDGKSIINDQVTFAWIKADSDYTLKGIVMDKITGKPAVDGDGEYILAVKNIHTPSEGAVNGYLSKYELPKKDAVQFIFNSTGMENQYVVFEYLFEGADDTELQVVGDQVDLTGVMTDDQGNPIAHADITNEDGSQTFSVPLVETDAFASENGLQEIQATKETKIKDKVACYNLIPGFMYKLVSKAVFTGSGESVKKDGKELTASTEFLALKKNITKTVSLPTFDATPYEGETITVQQWLYLVTEDGDVFVAEHTDVDNERQQIRFVGIHTTAQDMKIGANFTSSVNAVRERTDYVTCTNLNVGKEYTITTYLYEQDSRKKVRTKLGDYVTGTKTFIADQKDMVVPVTISYNPVECGLVGKVSVFFEYLTTLGKNVASHADIRDKDQSIYHPEVHTTLHETGSAVKKISTSGIINLTDTAEYVNLKEGYNFTFIAKFVNADTRKVISVDGREAVVEKSFVAASDDGNVEMSYSFDIQKSGLLKKDGTVSDVVCYEYVYYDGDLLYAEEDLTNRDQTISIDKLSGKLTIHKRELQDNDKPVEGVSFMLFKKAGSIIKNVDTENYAGLDKTQIKAVEGWKNKSGDMYIGTYVTDENGDIVVTDLTPGEYYVVETKTLDTYILCTDRPEFVIDGTNDVEITVTNEAKVGYITITGPDSIPSQGGRGKPGDTPDTGDKMPIVIILILLAVSLAGIITVVTVKKKKRSKALMVLIVMGAALCITPKNTYAAATDTFGDYVTETSTEVYYTDDETDYNFKFEEKKADDKNTYTLDRVEYDKKKTHSTEIKVDESVSKTEDNVSADYKAPENIKQNGYTYILSKSDVTEQSNPVHVEAYKDTGYVSSEPVPDKTMQYIYVDENGKEHELVLPYSRTETMESGNTDVTYSGAVSGLNYQYIQAGDQLVPSENFILNEDEMKTILSQNGYDLSGLGDFRFSASPETYTDANGNLCRNYTITASRSAVKYRVYYADDVDGIDVTYKAVDVYVLSDADKEKIDKQNKETLVTATAYYKVEDNTEVATETQVQKTAIKMSPAKKAVLAGSIILGVLVLIALALYLVKGGRRDTDRKSKRDIKRDYKEL